MDWGFLQKPVLPKDLYFLSYLRCNWLFLFWASCLSEGLRLKKCFYSATICLAAVLQFYFVFSEFIAPAFTVRTGGSFISWYSSPNKVFKDLGKYLSEGDVVLSDIYSSWSLPVYTGAKIIALWHTPPHIKDNFDRTEAIKKFYNPTTSNEERKEILIKYAATHILLNHYVFGNSNKLIEQQITRLGYPIVVKNEDYTIFFIQNIP